MKSVNDDLRMVEEIFNPNQANINEGVFITRNTNIAPYYNEYTD